MSEPDKIATMLMFGGRAEEAMRFYISLFADSGIEVLEHYGPGYPGPEGQVVHARFRLGGKSFYVSDTLAEQPYTFSPSSSFFVTCADVAEIERLYAALVEGGSAPMALEPNPFATRYAWVLDRFGVSWQLIVPL